jgi:hypothetical protein
MKAVARVFGWMISFAVVVAVGADATAPKSEARQAPNDVLESELLRLMYLPSDPLHVVCMDYGMCCGSLWFDNTQCQAEYTGFGGAIIAHFDGVGADTTFLTNWECGVDNLSRAPSPARVEKLRMGMSIREVEEVLALPDMPSDRPYCLSGYWPSHCCCRLHSLGESGNDRECRTH